MSENKAEQLAQSGALPVENAPEVKVEELEVLKKQLEEKDKLIADERKKTEELEKDRETIRLEKEEYARRFTQENSEKIKLQENTIESKVAARQAELENLSREMDDAAEKGQFKEMAKLSAKYARAEIELESLKNSKVEAPIKLKTATDIWIENHPQFNTDPFYNTVALTAHHKAVREGIRIESPEYFKFVEDALDHDFYNKKIEVQAPDKTLQIEEDQPQIIQSAAPSRSQSSSVSQPKISLTQNEVEIAMLTFGTRPGIDAATAKKMYWEAKQEILRNPTLN